MDAAAPLFACAIHHEVYLENDMQDRTALVAQWLWKDVSAHPEHGLKTTCQGDPPPNNDSAVTEEVLTRQT